MQLLEPSGIRDSLCQTLRFGSHFVDEGANLLELYQSACFANGELIGLVNKGSRIGVISVRPESHLNRQFLLFASVFTHDVVSDFLII